MSIRVTKDSRTIRTGKDYHEFRYEMWQAQEHRCIECGRWTSLTEEILSDNSFHVHHTNGRGMGGGKRSDTFLACKGLCGSCHRESHGQK